MSKQPHIIIFNPDQWRGDVLGHLGNEAAVTPTLDTWIQEDAVSFSNAFCQNPVCTPSRCSFMTGWYPHVRGHRSLYHMLRPDEPCLLKILKDNGYFVWWGGKNDLVPGQHGLDAYCHVHYQPERLPRAETNLHAADDWRGSPDGDNYYSFYAGNLGAEPDGSPYYDRDWANVYGAVKQIQNAPDDQPLCIFLALGYPHPPYGVEEPYFSQIDRSKLPPRLKASLVGPDKPSILSGIREGQSLENWTEDRWDALRATYYGMCARVDQQFALVLNALRDKGIYNDTAVFFFSDHGDYTGDYGLVEKTQNTFEDCLTKVPFLVKPPASVPVKPGVNNALVELIDMPVTVFELTGIEPGYSHFGRSLIPLLTGETTNQREYVFCEGGRRYGETHCMESEANPTEEMLYWPRLKLQLSDEAPWHGKGIMCRSKNFKYVRRLYEEDEFYDLRHDPGELHNRINDAACAVEIHKLKEALLTFLLETNDVVPHDIDQRNAAPVSFSPELL
ncbi:MAG: sulfatase-like hydrolase/transferase [Deinococcota bacterium]